MPGANLSAPGFFIMIYRSKKTQIALVLISVLAILIYLATRPCLFIMHGEHILLSFPVHENTPFSVRFIHSVQKTLVVENLVINESCDGFTLASTKYQSFGVGLPFLESDGVFRQEGDYFIMDHMNRQFPRLAFRTGVGTQFTLLYQGKEYPLYQRIPVGGKIDLKIWPYYTRYLR